MEEVIKVKIIKEKRLKGNELVLCFVDSILQMIDRKLPTILIDTKKIKKEFDFNFFDEDSNFYIKVLSHPTDNTDDKNKIYQNIHKSPKFFLRNLIIFLNYLKLLLKANVDVNLYKDPIIKLDISLIIGYLVNKYGAKIVEAIDFFKLCIKELENKYKMENINIITKFDEEIMKSAKDYLEDLKNTKKQNFSTLISFLKDYFFQSGDYRKYEIINNLEYEFNNDINILSMKDLDNKYFNNEAYKDYFELYLEKTLLMNGYIKKNNESENELYNEKKKELENHLFFSDILKIDLNNIDNCILLLYFQMYIYKDYKFFDIDGEFSCIQETKDAIIDYTENLKKIIEEESFINDLKIILNCSSVKKYFEKVRRFSDNGYGIEMLEEEDMSDIDDDYLKEGFHKLCENLEKDRGFLSKLIIFKYLPQYKRAFVDPNMRIAINPIYFKFSESMNEDTRNNIFRAYLFIIVLHEIVHLVKFMKKEKNEFNNIPKTPKNKEGGKMFINYLFNLPTIYYITNRQASLINNPKNWNNLEDLIKIFEEQKIWYEMHKNDNNEKSNRPSCKDKDSISFYLSLIEENDDNVNSSDEPKDDWYDID